MSTMVSEVFEALIEAGASQEKAKAAAEAMASESLATKDDIASIKAELLVMKWMLGIVVVATVIPFLKTVLGFGG